MMFAPLRLGEQEPLALVEVHDLRDLTTPAASGRDACPHCDGLGMVDGPDGFALVCNPCDGTGEAG